MKKILYLIAFTLTWSSAINAQSDSTGFDGDHFSLEGAIDLFKKANSPETFERLLNDQKQEVNNLDLNQDGEVDYIRVIDHKKGEAHAIVLQVPVNETEAQDIAVIEIEKTGKASAILQIIGNEEVYGEEVIAEPFEEEQKGSKARGPGGEDYFVARVVVNVWSWPCVVHIYSPGYVLWVSPWRWRLYPAWWAPWRPVPWHRYHRVTIRWRPHYHRVTIHRVDRAHRVYAPRRTSSVTVTKRTTVTRSNQAVQKKTTRSVRKSGNKVLPGTKPAKKAVKRSPGSDKKATKAKVKKSTRKTKRAVRKKKKNG